MTQERYSYEKKKEKLLKNEAINHKIFYSNWKEYNEHLVRRGEIYVSLDFLENWGKELEKMNKGKRGRPYTFPHSFMLFLSFIHIAFLPFRQLEGFLKGK